MNQRYSPAELAGLTMRQMEAHINAERLRVVVNKSKTKAKVASEILACYAADDFDAAKLRATTDILTRPVNPALENLVTQGSPLDEKENSPANQGTEPVENRGGARPGAGRPLGMDAQRARMTHVSDCPHPAVLGVLNLLFDGWASAVGCPGVALTRDEAADLALPWTNVLEYTGVADHIPVWIELAITCTWNTVNVLKAKLRLAREAAAARKRPVEVEVKADVRE